MRLQAIPDDQKLLADQLLERLQELHDLRAADRTGEEPKVEAGEAHSGDHPELLPAEAVLKNRGFAPWSPGPRATGSFGQTRLVDEDDGSPLPRRYFLAPATFSSSRSRWPAHRAGVPGLQAAVRSNPYAAASSTPRRASDEHRSAPRSTRQSAAASTTRSHIRPQSLRPSAAAPALPTGHPRAGGADHAGPLSRCA